MASPRTQFTSALVQAAHGQEIPDDQIAAAVNSLGGDVREAYDQGGVLAAAQAADPFCDPYAGLAATFQK